MMNMIAMIFPKIRPLSFYFLRHFQTNWNALQLCQGQKDIPLNSIGINDAHRIGKLMAKMRIHSICFSPLIRAAETAKIMASYFPQSKLYPIKELQERAWGKLEGLSNQYMYQYEEEELSGKKFEKDKDIESYDHFLSRVAKGVNIALEAPLPILIVSHGRVFQTLCQLLNVPLKTRQFEHCQLIKFQPKSNQKDWELEIVQLL
jgi:broad specificity phosphatase PhoE